MSQLNIKAEKKVCLCAFWQCPSNQDILKNLVLDIVLEDVEYNNRIELINYLMNNTSNELHESMLLHYQSKFIKKKDFHDFLQATDNKSYFPYLVQFIN